MGPAGVAVICIFTACLASSAMSGLADRRVPDRSQFAFTLPVDSKRAVTVLQQALIAAGVPSGIEQAPLGSDPERASRGPVRTSLRFNGRKVRDGSEGTRELAQISLLAEDTAYVLFPPRKPVIEKSGS
jgi:hypothetical protein